MAIIAQSNILLPGYFTLTWHSHSVVNNNEFFIEGEVIAKYFPELDLQENFVRRKIKLRFIAHTHPGKNRLKVEIKPATWEGPWAIFDGDEPLKLPAYSGFVHWLHYAVNRLKFYLEIVYEGGV